jgi:hypothetical protein
MDRVGFMAADHLRLRPPAYTVERGQTSQRFPYFFGNFFSCLPAQKN